MPIDGLDFRAGIVAITTFGSLHAKGDPNTVSLRFVDRVMAGAVRLGADRQQMLAFLGLREASLRNPMSRVSIVVPLRLISMLESQLADPAINIRIAFADIAEDFSAPEFALRYLPNLHETISTFQEGQSSRQSVAPVSLISSASSHFLTWQVAPEQTEMLSRFVEFSVAFYLRLSRDILGESAIVRDLQFMHAPRFDPTLYAQLFGFLPEFGRPRSLVQFTSRQLFRPALQSKPELLAAAVALNGYPQKLIDAGQTIRGMAYLYAASQLPHTPVTLEHMAESFGIGPRTLRRRLVEEGQSFRDLIGQVRRDYARLYQMEGSRSVAEIAVLLGYGEISAFTRSHKRWTGRAPSKRE